MKKTGRREFFAQVAALAALGALGGAGIAQGGSVSSILDSEKLKAELRVTTEAQGAYVDDVVEKAKDGELPVKIVTASYRYAMRREVGRRPLYFKICVEHLAKQAGLKLSFLSF